MYLKPPGIRLVKLVMTIKLIDSFLEHVKNGEKCRVVAFGSSNTQRRLPGMHWLDCFELAMTQTYSGYGGIITCVNSGIGGDTTRGLLARFDEQVALYRPLLTFITIGGNDATAENKISPAEFGKNLNELYARCAELGSIVIFQTYYAFIAERLPPQLGPGYYDRFLNYMDIVRKAAANNNAYLIDHLSRWEPLRKKFPEIYLSLMEDQQHVHEDGNILIGLDIIRHFKTTLDFGWKKHLNNIRAIQMLMDRLESEK